MRKTKKLTLSVSLVVLLAVTASTPVQAAIKVSNTYSSSNSAGSIVSLRSYTPWVNDATSSTPVTPSTPVNSNSTSTGYNKVVSLKNYKYSIPSTPTTPTQPAPTQPVPTQPSSPAQPTTPTQPATPPTSGTTTASTQEEAMINEINKERAAAGLAPVKVDLRLAEVAQLKANDMNTNGYFSHTSPTYGSPYDMLRAAGIQYRAAGENIARNRSVDFAMAAFMSSDGHRKNILNPAYTHVGVGVVSNSSGNYYVQIFASL
ncbi:MAG: CAP domain-containing protein [Desulfitobacterium sp.]